ncbi:amidohydrolase [Candidatus Bipolaricaulota bacterium]|nr:amidohydrolase [Candidatus Bipolaricaulota bacterium]
MKIHLKNFDILNSTSSSPIKGGSVIVRDNRIENIIPEDIRENSISADRTIQGDGRLLLPGFVNAHSHLGMTIFRGYADDIELDSWLNEWIWPAEENLTPEEVYWASLLGIVEAIHSGTTTIADMYFYMDQTARAIEETGIRGLISYGLIAEELDQAGREELQAGLDLAEDWDGKANGRIRVALSPHAPYTCGSSVLKKVSKMAERKGIPIHTHISETKREVEDSFEEFGVSPVERLESLGVLENEVLAAHCVHINNEDMEILEKNDVVVAHNPSSNMKLSSGAAPINELRNRGVNVLLGTDGPGTNNDLDAFGEMRQAAFLAKLKTNDPTALSAGDTLALATGEPVDQFGLLNLGRIKEGNRADLIGLTRDAPHWTPEYNTVSNLVYSGKVSDVDMMMVDGNMVMEEGNINGIDEEKIINKVNKIGKKYGKIKKEG